MSLTVKPALLEKASCDEVSLDEFLECVEESLPLAWRHVKQQIDVVESGAESSNNLGGSMDPDTQGQLIRMFASTSMRTAIEAKFNVRLAFQNCHATAVFRADAVGSERWNEFISPRAQLLNQRPDLVNC